MPEERGDKKGMKKRPARPEKSKGSAGIGGRMGQGVADRTRPSGAGQQVRSSQQRRPRTGQASAVSEEERVSLEQRASSLQSRLNDLRGGASLSGLRDRLEDLDSALSGLPTALEKVRQGGYVFKGYLENKADVLRQQWQGLGERIDREAAQRGRQLERQVSSLQKRLSAMGARLNEASLAALEREVSGLDSEVEAAQSAIAGLFDTVSSNVQQTTGQIQKIEWTLEQVAEASFRLRVEENVVDAVSAQYMTEEKDGPKGILLVTDQRILFEQKEEVATKKFLFVTTEKERIQKVLLEAPIGAVEKAKPSERRALVLMKEMLELTFGPQAPVTLALFQLQADSDTWQALINRIITGDIDQERVGAAAAAAAPAAGAPEAEGAPAPAPAEPAAAAPTTCPTCGANITTEIVRGMRSISCEYCGAVIRL